MPDANGVPTTFEMDGLFTQADIDNRFNCHIQCVHCLKWTAVDSRARDYKCSTCGGTAFDVQSMTSNRTFDFVRASKRKIKFKK